MKAVLEAPFLAVAAPPRSLDELVAELPYLSPGKKLEIITRLAQSLQGAPVAAVTPASLPAFVGAWANDLEADKMEQAILAVRHAANEPDSN